MPSSPELPRRRRAGRTPFMGPTAVRSSLLAVLAHVLVVLSPAALSADALAMEAVQIDTVKGGMSGAELYGAACANCHGVDGAGADPAMVGFEEPLPDFTNCSFASREPDADWVGVAHEGGPTRGFSAMMPAFGDALSPEQLQRVMDYVRSFCGDDDWPRGELNLPRPMLTEKAYPEDEWVYTVDVGTEGRGRVMNELVWEKRFGARNQFELVVPWGFRERPSDDSGVLTETEWVGGIGDVVLGVKRDLFHSLASGSIVSAAVEAKFPTGDEADGFGGKTTVLEAFVSYGQILPADAFLQLQGIFEDPVDGTTEEVVWRGALGRTWVKGAWGRAWSPMIEVQGKRELATWVDTEWSLAPQLQVTLNTRQHVMLNTAVLIPLDDASRDTRVLVYLLWDFFDGGFFEGW